MSKLNFGESHIDVEVEKKDLDNLITMALDKLTPYYEGHRFVQASGEVIDLSLHHPVAIVNVYQVNNKSIVSLNDYVYGGANVVLYDTSFMDRLISYKSFKMLFDEIKHQKGQNYKLIGDTLYLDGYDTDVVIEMLVRPKVVSDVLDDSMYHSWLKEYVLALTKEMLGRIRGKFFVDGSPYTLDSATLLQEAMAEKERLENQLQGEIFVI